MLQYVLIPLGCILYGISCIVIGLYGKTINKHVPEEYWKEYALQCGLIFIMLGLGVAVIEYHNVVTGGGLAHPVFRIATSIFLFIILFWNFSVQRKYRK